MIYAKYIFGFILLALSGLLYGYFKGVVEPNHFWVGNIGAIITWCVAVYVAYEIAPKKFQYCEVCRVELSDKCVDCDVEQIVCQR